MFPPVPNPEALKTIVRDDAALRDGVAAVCARHGLATEPMARLPGGSVPVYGVGEGRVLKLFPPGEHAYAQTEWRALLATHGRLPLPIPEPIATGTADGWSYVLMSRLRGRLLVHAWPELDADDRDRLATELGHCLAALHTIDDVDLGHDTDWNAFLTAQRASAVDRQRARGLDERWIAQIPDFLATTPTNDQRRVLLHTELMREHLFVTRSSAGWTLSGLFDFEPAMVGAPEYDLVSFGVFVSGGDGRFLRRALLAYGMPPDALDETMQRRLLA